MSSQQNWQRGTNQYGNQYDHRGDGAAQGGNSTHLLYIYLAECICLYRFLSL
jgi:hypothetical protein